MGFQRSVPEPVPKDSEEGFAKAGIATFHGRARFVGRSTVQVGEEVLEGRYVVITTGQRPADLRIPGEENLTTRDQFLDIDELPKRIVFVGGRYIAFESSYVPACAVSPLAIVHIQ